jgi:hypothetical protein
MTESNSGQPSCRGAIQRLQTKGEDLLKRFAQTGADNPPTLARNHMGSLSSESCPEFNARQCGQTHFHSRFTQQVLIDAELISSVVVTWPGSRRGRRLIDGDSLDSYLESFTAKQASADMKSNKTA